eukprot:gene9380-biopygen10726
MRPADPGIALGVFLFARGRPFPPDTRSPPAVAMGWSGRPPRGARPTSGGRCPRRMRETNDAWGCPQIPSPSPPRNGTGGGEGDGPVQDWFAVRPPGDSAAGQRCAQSAC